MSLTVNFRTSEGELTNRQFPIMTGVSIYGTVYGSLGIPDFGASVQLNIKDSFGNDLLTDFVHTNIFGDYDSFFVTPRIDTKANCTISATHTAGGTETLIIPIAIGNVIPDPLPITSNFSLWDLVPIAGIALLAFFVYKKI